MELHPKRLAALSVLIVALAAPAHGGATAGKAQALEVDLTEWAVVPSQGHLVSGPLQLTVKNYGVLRHRLAIIPTELWGDALPVRNGRAVGVAAAKPVIVAPGQERSTEIDLAPGAYVLLDNIRGHYALGAAVSILVTR
jgi:hypothetical protein